MKTIGLVGGTGWVSTLEYYRLINRESNRRLGGLNSARLILYSVNMGEIDACKKRNDDEGHYQLVRGAAETLALCGAEGLVLCANTLHMFAQRLTKEIPIPLIHIAEAVAREIKKAGMAKVGLLGTRQTVEMPFYRDKLNDAQINVLVPDEDDRAFIHHAIMDELLKEVFLSASRRRFLDIMEKLKWRGVEGIILGCTEIPLLVRPEDIGLPMFNTLEIHARAAVDFALA